MVEIPDKEYKKLQDHVKELEGKESDLSAAASAKAERKQAEEQLKAKMAELEEFHDLAVDRELKMIEMQKEIETLKRSLDETRDKQMDQSAKGE